MWRPLLFASLDPDVAAARGVPVRALSLLFMLVLGAAVAAAIQVVGALLVLSVMVTPAAAALQLGGSRARTVAVSIGIAVVALVGGVMLAVGGSLPISPYVTTIAFLLFVVCRVYAWVRARRERRGARRPEPVRA
jgi:zinc/manganese transport system permease protein